MLTLHRVLLIVAVGSAFLATGAWYSAAGQEMARPSPPEAASPSPSPLLAEIAAQIRDNYARLGGVEVTVETTVITPGVDRPRRIVSKTGESGTLTISQSPRVTFCRHTFLRGSDFRSDSEGENGDSVWTRLGDRWTHYVPHNDMAWIYRREQLPGMSSLDPREIASLEMQDDFADLLAQSKLIESTETQGSASEPWLSILVERIAGRLKGLRQRYTFDRSKNSLPVAVEYLVKPNEVNLKLDITYQEVLPGAAWFLKEAKTTFLLSGQTTTTRIVGAVAHHQTLSDDTFKIAFPDRTEIRDSASGSIYRANGKPKIDENTLVKVGDVAPDFELTSVDGQTYRLRDLRDKIVLVYFFSFDSSPDLDFAQNLWERLGPRQLVVLALARDADSNAVASLKEEAKYTFPMAADPDRAIYGRFARKGIPRLYLVDRDGRIAFQGIAHDDQLDRLTEWVTKELPDEEKPSGGKE